MPKKIEGLGSLFAVYSEWMPSQAISIFNKVEIEHLKAA